MTQGPIVSGTPADGTNVHTSVVVAKEVNKLVALLRNTARFATVGEAAGDSDYLEKLSRSKYERGGAHGALMVALRICIDPGISAPITAAALEAASLLFKTLTTKEQTESVGQVVHLACKTQFPEIDRERDELVFLGLLSLLKVCIKAEAVQTENLDEALTVVSRLAFTTSHSAVLTKLAKQTFIELGLRRFHLHGGVTWLCREVRRWLETAVAQVSGERSSEERLDALVELLIAVRTSGTSDKQTDLLTEYAVLLLLYHLLPGGQAAEAGGAQPGAVLKNPSLYGVLGKVLAVAVDLLSSTSDLNAAERVLMALLRPVAISNPEDPANSEDNAVHKVGGRRRWFNSPRILGLCVDAITEACRLNPGLISACFAGLDVDWRRVPLATSGLLDSVCSVVLGSLAVDFTAEGASISPRAKIQALLASLPDALVMDPPGQRLGSAEHAALRFIAEALPEPHGTFVVSPAASAAGRSAEVRAAVQATFAQVREKPKRTRDYVTALLAKYPELLNPAVAAAAGAVAGGAREDGVIAFLRSARGVPLEAVGEWLGQPENEAEVVKYVGTFDLRNLDIEETMRTVLATFRLPGEAQQISRVVEGIAKAHFQANAEGGGHDEGIFQSVDAEYTFLFSVIMLNTDQHNPNVTKRMDLKDFLRNNRGINDGQDIDEEYQTRVFNSIRSQQILTPKSDSLWAAPLWVRLVDAAACRPCSSSGSSSLVGPSNEGLKQLLESRGYDILAAISYASNMDPEDGEGYLGSSGVVGCLGRLADLSFSLCSSRDLAEDTVAVLRRNAINLFSGSMAKCRRNLRSLQTLMELAERHYSSALMQAVSEAVILYSVYAVVLIEGDRRRSDPNAAAGPTSPRLQEEAKLRPLQSELQRVIGAKETSGASGPGGGGGISGFLMKALFVEEPKTPEAGGQEDWVMAEELHWRWMIPEGLEEGPMVVELLEVLRGEKKIFTKITSKILVSCFELLTRPNCPDYLVQSGPWIIVLALRLADQQDAEIDVPVLVACLKLVARGLLEQTGRSVRAVKVNVAATLLLMRRLSILDPTHCDSSWLGEYLKEAVKNAELAAKFSQALGLAIKLLLTEGDKTWIRKFSVDVWRGILGALEVTKNSNEIFRDSLELVLCNDGFAERGSALTEEALGIYEGLFLVRKHENPVSAVSKGLVELALKAGSTGAKLPPGVLSCWLAIYTRICTRCISASKSKKSEILLDELASFRTLIAAGASISISFTSVQAALVLEKAVSVLSAVVALPAVSSNLVQSLVSVFNRLFLSLLDLLVAHPQFDQLWLMVLRAVLLAVKRGSDAEVDDGLYDVVTENLKNTLQLLLTAGVVDFPSESAAGPVWWKLTWDSVGNFCPGLVDEIKDALRPGLSSSAVDAQPQAEAQSPDDASQVQTSSAEESAETPNASEPVDSSESAAPEALVTASETSNTPPEVPTPSELSGASLAPLPETEPTPSSNPTP